MSSRSINSAKVSGVHLKHILRTVQGHNGKDLAADLEAQVVAPLQILGGPGNARQNLRMSSTFMATCTM